MDAHQTPEVNIAWQGGEAMEVAHTAGLPMAPAEACQPV